VEIADAALGSAGFTKQPASAVIGLPNAQKVSKIRARRSYTTANKRKFRRKLMKTSGLIILLSLAVLSGCVAPAAKINNVSIGMTKAEVLKVMGSPTSITADRNAEYLNYSLGEDPGTPGIGTPYEIKLVNGKVESFGRSSQAPAKRKPVVVPVFY
jgi:hypothetical protein